MCITITYLLNPVFLLLLVTEYVLTASDSNDKVVCRDNNGGEVPWFLIYKLPIDNKSSNSLLHNATKYAYLLPGQSHWQNPDHGVDHVNSLFGLTVSPIFRNPDKVGYVMYNSMPPTTIIHKRTWARIGHANGMVITDTSKSYGNGVWMTFSLPLFPEPILPNMTIEAFMNASFANDHRYSQTSKKRPRNDYENSQMLLCITLQLPSKTIIESIGNWVLRVHGYIFDWKNAFSNPEYSAWNQILEIQDTNITNLTKIECTNQFESHLLQSNPTIVVFVKKPECKYEIFADGLSHLLHTNFLVQSWTLHDGHMEPNCNSKYKVMNVISKVMNKQYEIGSEDHSKWGVGTSKIRPVVCISDLNRRVPNMDYGGLTICIFDPQLQKAFLNIIESIEDC